MRFCDSKSAIVSWIRALCGMLSMFECRWRILEMCALSVTVHWLWIFVSCLSLGGFTNQMSRQSWWQPMRGHEEIACVDTYALGSSSLAKRRWNFRLWAIVFQGLYYPTRGTTVAYCNHLPQSASRLWSPSPSRLTILKWIRSNTAVECALLWLRLTVWKILFQASGSWKTARKIQKGLLPALRIEFRGLQDLHAVVVRGY